MDLQESAFITIGAKVQTKRGGLRSALGLGVFIIFVYYKRHTDTQTHKRSRHRKPFPFFVAGELIENRDDDVVVHVLEKHVPLVDEPLALLGAHEDPHESVADVLHMHVWAISARAGGGEGGHINTCQKDTHTHKTKWGSKKETRRVSKQPMISVFIQTKIPQLHATIITS